MKTQYITSDGKIFDVKDEAEKYEASLNNDEVDEAFEEMKRKIREIDAKINALTDEIDKLYDEKETILKDWENEYLTSEQKDVVNTLVTAVKSFLGELVD